MCRSCGRYSVVFVTGERCPGRTERCSSSRSIRPVARLRWTSLTAGELGVTICGEPFGHLLFHFVLSHSGWRYVDVAYGETFAALVKGMQGALWELGGVPEVLRTDNLSAATHELKGSGGRALNERYAAVLAHYGLRSTRTNPRSPHENGVAEQGHHRS